MSTSHDSHAGSSWGLNKLMGIAGWVFIILGAVNGGLAFFWGLLPKHHFSFPSTTGIIFLAIGAGIFYLRARMGHKAKEKEEKEKKEKGQQTINIPDPAATIDAVTRMMHHQQTGEYIPPPGQPRMTAVRGGADSDNDDDHETHHGSSWYSGIPKWVWLTTAVVVLAIILGFAFFGGGSHNGLTTKEQNRQIEQERNDIEKNKPEENTGDAKKDAENAVDKLTKGSTPQTGDYPAEGKAVPISDTKPAKCWIGKNTQFNVNTGFLMLVSVSNPDAEPWIFDQTHASDAGYMKKWFKAENYGNYLAYPYPTKSGLTPEFTFGPVDSKIWK